MLAINVSIPIHTVAQLVLHGSCGEALLTCNKGERSQQAVRLTTLAASVVDWVSCVMYIR